jgi:hypothetical protein
MLPEDLPFRVGRIDGHDEVLVQVALSFCGHNRRAGLQSFA